MQHMQSVLQQDSAPAHRAAHVQQLTAASRNAKLSCAQHVASKQPKSQSCGLRDLGCHPASCLDELKRRLIDVWCGLQQSIFDKAIDQSKGRHQEYAHAKGGHFEYSL